MDINILKFVGTLCATISLLVCPFIIMAHQREIENWIKLNIKPKFRIIQDDNHFEIHVRRILKWERTTTYEHYQSALHCILMQKENFKRTQADALNAKLKQKRRKVIKIDKMTKAFYDL